MTVKELKRILRKVRNDARVIILGRGEVGDISFTTTWDGKHLTETINLDTAADTNHTYQVEGK